MVEFSGQHGTIKISVQNGAAAMEEIARIDLVKYRCISADIRSSVVVLTDNQQQHIIQRRGTAFWERYRGRFREIIEEPDYIFKDEHHANTAIACKGFVEDGKTVQLVIRLALTGDDPQLQNSVITAILENSKRFSQRLRNNRPLYKRE